MKQNVCSRNKYGYCKYGVKCRFKHTNELCVDKKCDVFACERRHPNPCRYYRDFGRCRFTTNCAYYHDNSISENSEKIKDIENKLKEIDKKDKKNKPTVTLGENVEKKLEAFEKDFDKKIERLENQIKKFSNIIDEQNSKVSNLEKLLEDKERSIASLAKRVEEIENKPIEQKIEEINDKKQEVKFQCPDCGFKTDSEKGLKTHVTRKHKTATKFPRECDLCEMELESIVKMKIHMRTHSFRRIEYKCEECDFCGDSELAMVVHNGRMHNENYECGLCNFVAQDLEALDIHLFTCEMYECCDCENRLQNLCDLKKHILEKHGDEKTLQVIHMKQDRANPEEFSNRKYKKEDLFQKK